MNYYTKSGYGLVKAPVGEKGDWVRAHDYDRMAQRVKHLQACLFTIGSLFPDEDAGIIDSIEKIVTGAFRRPPEWPD